MERTPTMPLRWNDTWTPWAAAAGVAALVAAWLACSVGFPMHDADTLVPKLTSTMEWSFYYWHAGRNGQLLPLLALPFAHPLTNLVAQQCLGTFAGVMAIYLLVAFATRAGHWFTSGTVAVACFLAGSTAYGHHLYLEGYHTCGTAMALMLGGLLLLRRLNPRRVTLEKADAALLAAAAVLVVTGIWVNFAVVIFAAALVAIDGLVHDSEEDEAVARWLSGIPGMPPTVRRWIVRTALPLGLLVFCFAIVMLATKLFVTIGNGERVTFAFGALADYPASIAKVMRRTCEMIVTPFGALLIAEATIMAAWLEGRGRRPPAVTVVAAAGLAFFLIVGGMRWVVMNEGHPRYVLPAIVAASACIGILLTATVSESVRAADEGTRGEPVWIVPARWAAAATIPVTLLLGYGWPDTGAPRRAIAGLGSPFAEQVVESGVEFVTGDYWSLWPVVFKANLMLHDRGETRRVWGLGLRALDTRHRWADRLRDGTAMVAHLAHTQRPCRHDLKWIGRHLDIEIGPREGSVGDLEMHGVRLRDERMARR